MTFFIWYPNQNLLHGKFCVCIDLDAKSHQDFIHFSNTFTLFWDAHIYVVLTNGTMLVSNGFGICTPVEGTKRVSSPHI